MRRLSVALLFIPFSWLSGQTHENLNSTLWAQSSAEYMAGALQVFDVAKGALSKALNDKQWTAALEQKQGPSELRKLKPAIILDLDETLLDNTPFEAKLIREGLPYSDGEWAKWVDQGRAPAIPGAIGFLNYVRGAGVEVFYITNRVCKADDSKDHTVALLAALKFPLHQGRLFCRANEAESNEKSSRRASVASQYRVLMLFGDDLEDFLSVPRIEGDAQAKLKQRKEIVAEHKDYWGQRWFILANPMYGSWERAVGSDVDAKRDALRP